MARFTIYSKDGTAIRYEGAPTYHGTYLNPSYLEFATIASPTPINWAIGDYVDYGRTGLRYHLFSLPQPTKKATGSKSGESFVYSNVCLYAYTKMLEIIPFRDLVLNSNEFFFSTETNVAFTENVSGVIARIQRNLNDYYPEDSSISWNILLQGGLNASTYNYNEARDVSVSGSCLDALMAIYNTWNHLGWTYSVVGGVHTIVVGGANVKSSLNTTTTYWYGNGLTSLRKNQSNKDEMATRVYVYGSEKNIQNRWYNKLDIYKAEGANITRLMLPTSSWGTTKDEYGEDKPDPRKAFLQNDTAIGKYGLIEKTILFDGSDNRKDIYPSIEDCSLSRLSFAKTQVGSTEYVPKTNVPGYNANNKIDEIVSATNPTDDGYLTTDGEKYKETKNVASSYSSNTQTVVNGSKYSNTITLGSCSFTNSGKISVSVGNHTPNVFVEVPSSVPSSSYTLKVTYVAKVGGENITIERTAKQSSLSVLGEVRTHTFSFDDFSAGTTDDPITGTIVFYATISIDTKFNLLVPSSYNITYGSKQGGYFEVGLTAAYANTFSIRTRQIGFDVMQRANLAGQSNPTLSFKTGMLAGREFTIKSATYDSELDQWVMALDRSTDDSAGMIYPNSIYSVASGDKFVLLNIAMPDEYIYMASMNLRDAGKAELDKICKVIPTYEPSIDSKFVVNNIANNPAKAEYKLMEGMYMAIYDVDITEGTEYIIIDSVTISESESNIPVYSVVLRDGKLEPLLKKLSKIRTTEVSGGGITRVNVVMYDNLSDKPTINGIVMEGNKDLDDLGAFAAEDFTQENIQDTLGISDWALAENAPTLDDVNDGATRKLSTKAEINSPDFTGTPMAQTASSGNNTRQLATAQFVQQEIDRRFVGEIVVNTGEIATTVIESITTIL